MEESSDTNNTNNNIFMENKIIKNKIKYIWFKIFCVPQKKDMHTGSQQHEGEKSTLISGWRINASLKCKQQQKVIVCVLCSDIECHDRVEYCSPQCNATEHPLAMN